MTNPTSNFGWQMPTATDLVTDLPADFETFGQAVDTSLADLKGGTSGQILSKASNTDMDFTWVTTDDANAIQNSIVDAKGDIVAASANDTPARLAVGANGETLRADSSTSTGLRWQESFAAYKNKLINSNFSVWQRGTSFTGTGNYFTADRWQGFRGGAVAGATWSRQTASLDGFQYSMRAQRDSGNTALNPVFVVQSLETDVTRQFHGKKITISFWAKAGANFSAASSNLGINIVTGTGTEASITAGFTSQTSTALTGATLTTSWQRFSATSAAVIPNTASQFALQFGFTPVGTAGAADNFEITGVQLEVGDVATGWSLAGATLQGELAACQRYYTRFTASSSTAVAALNGFGASTTLAIFNQMLPVSMRVAPTALDGNNLAFYNFRTGATLSGGTFVIWQGYPYSVQLRYTHGSAVFAINDIIDIVGAASAATFIGLSAEL